MWFKISHTTHFHLVHSIQLQLDLHLLYALTTLSSFSFFCLVLLESFYQVVQCRSRPRRLCLRTRARYTSLCRSSWLIASSAATWRCLWMPVIVCCPLLAVQGPIEGQQEVGFSRLPLCLRGQWLHRLLWTLLLAGFLASSSPDAPASLSSQIDTFLNFALCEWIQALLRIFDQSIGWATLQMKSTFQSYFAQALFDCVSLFAQSCPISVDCCAKTLAASSTGSSVGAL